MMTLQQTQAPPGHVTATDKEMEGANCAASNAAKESMHFVSSDHISCFWVALALAFTLTAAAV